MSRYDHENGREFAVTDRRSEMGKSRILIRCPFCQTSFWAFIWSISGGGKKCENKACGAMHVSHGMAYPVKGKS